MIIADLETTDSGSYYCCLPSNCSTQIDQDRCQKFALTVTVEGRDQLDIELYWLMLVTVFEQSSWNNGIISKNSDLVTPVLIIPYFR